VFEIVIEMRKGMGQPCQLPLTVTEESMKSWIRTKHLVFCSGYNLPTLFRNLQKRYVSCREHGILQVRYLLWSTV